MQSIVRKGQGVSGHFIGRLCFDILIKNEYKTKNCISSEKKPRTKYHKITWYQYF